MRVQAQGREQLEFPGERVSEIHEACVKAGIPVESVRFNEGKYEIVMPAGAENRRGDAEAVKEQILSRPRPVVVVDNLNDALVVLQFEPGNASARALVQSRYQELKTAASAKAAASPR